MKSLKINAILNTIRTVVGLIFPLITFPYVSRILEPVGLGKINFVNSIISYFSMIAALGINTYGMREAAKIRDDKISLSKFVKEILSINLLSTTIAYVLLAFSLIFIPKFSDYRSLLIVCSASILFVTLGMDWLYSALEEFSYITIRSILFQIISLVFMFIFVRTKEDYLKYAAIGVFSSVGSNVCNFIHSRKYINFTENYHKEINRHIKSILTLFVMTIAISIYTALDITMLGFISDDEQVGYYSAATKINKIIISVITATVAVLLPRLSYYISQHDNKQFDQLAEKALKVILTFSLPSVVGLSLLARPVILLLCGINYENAISTMRIMNPIILAISLSGLIGVQIFMPLGKEKITLVSVVIGAITNFTLNIILIPKYGAFGAGCATLCAETFVTVFQIICARKIFVWKRIFLHFFQCIISTLIMAAIVYMILNFNINVIAQLITSIFVGAIVYLSSLLLLRNQFCLSLLKEILNK